MQAIWSGIAVLSGAELSESQPARDIERDLDYGATSPMICVSRTGDEAVHDRKGR
jgi:hypothetical protein